jgi:chromosomal replication initiation ATPase DnaA
MLHDYILNIIELETGVTIDMIRSQSRKQIIVFARHIAAYLIHQYSNYTLKHIGMILNRDHSSVHFAIRNVDNMLTYRNALHDLFDLVSNKLETIKPKLCTTTSTCCVES